MKLLKGFFASASLILDTMVMNKQKATGLIKKIIGFHFHEWTGMNNKATYMIIPDFVIIVDNSRTKTPGWNNASSGDRNRS